MAKKNEKKVRHASIVLSGTPDAEYVYSHGTEGIEGKEKKGEKEEKNAQANAFAFLDKSRGKRTAAQQRSADRDATTKLESRRNTSAFNLKCRDALSGAIE